jgi:hypothetical protein
MIKLTALFNTQSCGRCGSSGRHSYCQMHGTVCFQCGGSGSVFTKAHKGMAAELMSARRTYTSLSGSQIKVGDEIRRHSDEPYRTVTEITAVAGTEQSNSGSFSIGGEKTYRGYLVLTFQDGSQQRVPENLCMDRKYSFAGLMALLSEGTRKHIESRLAAKTA